MNSHTNHHHNTQQGFAVLYAVLVASVVAIGGLLLSNIIFKQLVLTGVGQNSQIAYYAADVGRACAKYWNNSLAFGLAERNGDSVIFDGSFVPETIFCFDAGEEYALEDGALNENGGTWNFMVTNINENSCARVEVSNSITEYSAISVGYNNPTCNPDDPRLVIRQVQDYAAY